MKSRRLALPSPFSVDGGGLPHIIDLLKWVPLFLLVIWSGAFQAAPAGGKTKLEPGLESALTAHLNLVYARYGDRELELDLYRPKDAQGALPAVLCVHGGGWWQGTRKSQSNLAKALAARGFVTATITYRLSGEAPFPAAIHDCKAAIRFLRAKAEEFGIDPRAIGATGLSAGGHLVALLATSGSVDELEGDGGHPDFSSSIQAVVPVGAQTDLRRHHDFIERSEADPPGEKPNIWLQFLGARPSEAPDRWAQASPLTHLDSGDPPILLVTGGNDQESTHGTKFRGRAKELGIDTDLVVIEDAPHAFLSGQNWFSELVDAADDWFGKHLRDR